MRPRSFGGLTPEERHALPLRILGAQDDIEQSRKRLDELESMAAAYISMSAEIEIALALPGKTVWLRGRECEREDAEQQLVALGGRIGLLQQTRNTYQDVIRTNRRNILELRAEADTPDAAPRKLKPGDILVIEVLEALPGRPITGERTVRQDGTISLGFYGDLDVAGLDRVEIKKEVD